MSALRSAIVVSGVSLTFGSLLGCGGPTSAATTVAGRAGLTVSDAAVGATGGTDTAAYLTIENRGAADRLVGVDSPDAASVTMHTTVGGGGISAMQDVNSLEVPADGSLRLDPGGTHLMITGTRKVVAAGDVIRLRLHFERSAERDVSATAVPLSELPERVARR